MTSLLKHIFFLLPLFKGSVLQGDAARLPALTFSALIETWGIDYIGSALCIYQVQVILTLPFGQSLDDSTILYLLSAKRGANSSGQSQKSRRLEHFCEVALLH